MKTPRRSSKSAPLPALHVSRFEGRIVTDLAERAVLRAAGEGDWMTLIDVDGAYIDAFVRSAA